jgi:hypothetical protein
MLSTDFMCQQSPSFGRPATGATSGHHWVTPTSDFFAPMAQRMDVALGASDTMRCEIRVELWLTGRLPSYQSR